MLAQSFMSAADLGITEPQRDALQKVLVLLETGKLVHVPDDAIDFRGPLEERYSGLFNMGWTTVGHDCGTVACIKGTACLITGLPMHGWVDGCDSGGLYELFFTQEMNDHDITPIQAARALRSYLTTGDAKWDEAVA